MNCRVHGPTCGIPWGYDPGHTDQRHPYTLAELAERTEPPHRYAYPTSSEYVQGFHLYRAIKRDKVLTPAEGHAKLEVLMDARGVPRELLEDLEDL